MKEERFKLLLEQYVTDMINKEDRKEFLSLLQHPYYNSLLEKEMEKEWNHGEYEDPENAQMGQLIEQNVIEKIRQAKVIPIKTGSLVWMRKLTAIAVVLILVAGAYYLVSKDTPAEKSEIEIAKKGDASNDVLPGSNKAVLTLSNRREIVLDSIGGGTIIHEGSTRLDKTGNGTLAYVAAGKATHVLYNTVQTPNGGQYHVKLVDGTEVWLNAASSITFPTAFVENERKVEITGEAYFEVAHNARKPFKVAVKGMEVEVLGTHFNVNAYADEGLTKTTLVQGKIKVSQEKSAAILSPGQQARINAASRLSVVKHANVEEALAWKNGDFKFSAANVRTVMAQVGRWYNVAIVYEKGFQSAEPYSGGMSRSTNTPDVIKILNGLGIKCRLEGRKIIVMK
jgi:hypothetical protein